MKKIRLEYEEIEYGKWILCDVSNCHNPRFCGKDGKWSMEPNTDEPFVSKLQARLFAKKYFTGTQ